MTAAFEKFMKQHRMRGSEKADGYSQDAFLDLDEYEKKKIFDLLVMELPWSIEWLFFICQKQALIVAKKMEETLRGEFYQDVYKLQEQIVKYSGDFNYQKRMMEDYQNYMDSSKPGVLDSIGRTPATREKLDFLKHVILAEVNRSAVVRAARYFLDDMNIPCANEVNDDNFERLVTQLCSENLLDKNRAIAEIERYRLPSLKRPSC